MTTRSCKTVEANVDLKVKTTKETILYHYEPQKVILYGGDDLCARRHIRSGSAVITALKFPASIGRLRTDYYCEQLGFGPKPRHSLSSSLLARAG